MQMPHFVAIQYDHILYSWEIVVTAAAKLAPVAAAVVLLSMVFLCIRSYMALTL